MQDVRNVITGTDRSLVRQLDLEPGDLQLLKNVTPCTLQSLRRAKRATMKRATIQ